MKILFVEDNTDFIEYFLPKLQAIGEVSHCKSRNNAFSFLDSESFDLIVCDHNILLWEQDKRMTTATDIYRELRMGNKDSYFIHFSSDPCPEKYEAGDDFKFFSLKKEYGVNLVRFIQEKIKI